MKRKRILAVLGFCTLTCAPLAAQNLFEKGETTTIYVSRAEKDVVQTAVGILQKDVENVFQARLERTYTPAGEPSIVAGTLGDPVFPRSSPKNEWTPPPSKANGRLSKSASPSADRSSWRGATPAGWLTACSRYRA